MTDFSSIQTFAFFVGYPRSGHSLVGACIDAHPNAVISHELDALAMLNEGKSREEIFTAICERSKSFFREGNEWSGYSYRIDGMWQGKSDTLRLIGDKRGGASARHLTTNPELMDKIKHLAPDYKIIHVVRNPFDSISTSVIKQEEIRQKQFTTADLKVKADEFFEKAATIQALIKKHPEKIHTLHHEHLLLDPQKVLVGLCEFLKLEIIDDHIKACGAIIWPSAQKSRHKIGLWNAETVDYILQQNKKYPFLESYTFDS